MAPRRIRQRPEEALHMAVARFLDVALPSDAVWWHTPNGGKRTRVEAGKFKAMGVRAGVADVLILYQGRLLAIELKRPEGARLSRTQEAWRDTFVQAGGKYHEARSLEGVEDALWDGDIPHRARPIGRGLWHVRDAA